MKASRQMEGEVRISNDVESFGVLPDIFGAIKVREGGWTTHVPIMKGMTLDENGHITVKLNSKLKKYQDHPDLNPFVSAVFQLFYDKQGKRR